MLSWVRFAVVLFLLLGGSGARAEPVEDARDGDLRWCVQIGAYAHWLSSDDFKGPPYYGGVEYRVTGSWSGGFSLFNNSFGQFSQYLYVGKSFQPWSSHPEIRVNLTAGVVHGYRDDFYDTLPIRWGGSWGLGVVPAVGIQKGRVGYDVALLGVSGLLFLVGYQL